MTDDPKPGSEEPDAEKPKAGGGKPSASASRSGRDAPAGARSSGDKKPADGKSADKKPGDRKPSADRKTAAGDKRTDPATLRLIAAAVVSLLVGLLLGALLFGGDGDDEDSDASAAPTGAQILTPEDLATEAQSLGRPVYWAGPQGDSSIEFERTPEGNTSVRYIPAGEDAEGSAGDYLTVVTYPYPEAQAALREQASSGDVFSRELPKGGFAISQPGQPTNAYVAYEGEDYQVEVYDPRPGQALQLVLDGAVVNAAG